MVVLAEPDIPRRATLEIMDGRRRWRWERLLLLLATVLGVVAMHATVASSDDQAGPMAGVANVSAASPAGQLTGRDPMTTLPADAAGSSVSAMPSEMPMPVAHKLLHLCLAITALGLLIGLLVAVAVAPARPTRALVRSAGRVAARPSRPPVPHAVRLAQLCVMRN